MRIYISGAMTGISDYAERFERAEAYLRDEYGPEAEIINPARVLAPLPETTTWGQYMDVALNALRGVRHDLYAHGLGMFHRGADRKAVRRRMPDGSGVSGLEALGEKAMRGTGYAGHQGE